MLRAIAVAWLCVGLVTVASAFQNDPVYRVGNGVTAPVITKQVEPVYEETAKEAGIEGSVLLSLIVNEEGMPTNVKVERSLDLWLDDEAVEAVQKWRFRPGRKDGKPVKVKVTVEVRFHLDAKKK